MDHSNLEAFQRTKVQNLILLRFLEKCLLFRRRRHFYQSPPNHYGPSSSLSYPSHGFMDMFLSCHLVHNSSGKKKEHKDQLFEPAEHRVGWGGLPCEGVGFKKFGLWSKPRENRLFRRAILGYPETTGAIRKSVLKCFVFIFQPNNS